MQSIETEHQLKVATLLNMKHIFNDDKMQFVYSEYPLWKRGGFGSIDLIFVDKQNRYVVIELKKNRNFRIDRTEEQLNDYRKGLMQRFGLNDTEVSRYFRFSIISDIPYDGKFRYNWPEFYRLDKALLNLQNFDFTIDKIDEHRMRELKPKIMYSVDEALKLWETPKEIREIIKQVQNSIEHLIPPFFIEVELMKRTTELKIGRKGLNLVSPYLSWKRFGTFQLRKRFVRFYFKIDSLVNPTTLNRLGDYSKYNKFEPVNWNMSSKWTHQIMIHSSELQQFYDFCSWIRDDLKVFTSQRAK